MRVWILSAVVLCVGCDAATKGDAPGTAASATTTAAAPASTGTSAVDVKLVLKNYDELQALIASKKGKVVVVDCWSTYCDPCMKEFPGLVGLHKKYGAEKVACISMCTNYAGLGKPEDETAEPLAFLQKQGATFDNLFSTDADETLYKKLKIASVPCIFVYDTDGKLVKTFDNETTYAVVEETVKPLVK